MNASSLKLGFVGLGIMGAPMAGHLLAAGHQLFVNTLGKIPAQIAESSATQCTTAVSYTHLTLPTKRIV